MRIEAWDTVFVRASRSDVHPLVSDIPGWPLWWPAITVRRHGSTFALEFRTRTWQRSQRVRARLSDVRADKGIRLRYSGDFDGEAEWYYLDERAGTLVHHLLTAETSRRGWRRRVAIQRAAVRNGLHGLKDLLEAGRVIGEEPDPALLEHQRRVQRRAVRR